MIQLTPFEAELRDIFGLNDKDARRLCRVVDDLVLLTGMNQIEIFDFLKFGADDEFNTLKSDYDWESFKRKITKRLKLGL